jgi:hypothetical protein
MYYDRTTSSYIFEVGEKVRIADRDTLLQFSGCRDRQQLGICSEMLDAAGQVFEIEYRYLTWSDLYRYHLVGIGYKWSADFFVCKGNSAFRVPSIILKGVLIARELSDSAEMIAFTNAVALGEHHNIQKIEELFANLNYDDKLIAHELSNFCGFEVPYFRIVEKWHEPEVRDKIRSHFIK